MSEFDHGPPAQFAELFDRVPDPPVKDDFWFDWGPIFYRSARWLGAGECGDAPGASAQGRQAPIPSARFARRAFTRSTVSPSRACDHNGSYCSGQGPRYAGPGAAQSELPLPNWSSSVFTIESCA